MPVTVIQGADLERLAAIGRERTGETGGTRSARSTKRPTTRLDSSDPVVKENALLAFREGARLADVHRDTGIPKATLSRWAKQAGHSFTDAGARQVAAAAKATEHVHRAARVGAAAAIQDQVDEVSAYLAAVARTNAEAAELILEVDPDTIRWEWSEAGPYVVCDDDGVREAIARAKLLAQLPLSIRDAVGIQTRGVHDLALLAGEATERGEIVVRFGVPRPDPATVVVAQSALTR